jgi:dolichol-phosphate mannosyltransferase
MSHQTHDIAAEWQVPSFDQEVFSGRKTRYCVCIPVINEGNRILTQLRAIQEQGIGGSIDVVVADGGSTDGSMNRERLKALGVRTLLTKTGPGKLSAQLRMGYSWALSEGYEGVVTVDGNGKDGVEAIPRFIAELDAGVDFVQGSRHVPGGEAINTPRLRQFAITFIHVPVLRLAAGFRYTDTTNGFRGYSRRLLLDPRVQPFRNIFSTYELLAYLSARAPRLGLITKEIPVRRSYPKNEKIPTKISVLNGNWLLIKILWNTLRGAYDPPLS